MSIARRWLLVWPPALWGGQDDFRARRERMVREQIEWRGVKRPEVLAALRATPRHEFIPPELAASAYDDRPLPIGHGQTISQPYIVGVMTELLEVGKTHKVLEIGTGSGYQAAVLSPLAGQVYSIEIVPQLAARSAETLARLGCRNVTVRQGDGYRGWPEQAPFDRIIITAAPPEAPPALIEQLKRGGRMVVPVGAHPEEQELQVIEKDAAGTLRRRPVFAVRFVPMVPGK